MRNSSKIALVGAAIIVVAAMTLWVEAMPVSGAVLDDAPGTMAHAVATKCDLTRAGTFDDQAVRDALTCRDLAAQEGMALSTARLVWLAWLQIFVAVAGAATVIWTVTVSLKSIQFTREALDHQKTATRLELRPSFVRLPPVVAMLSSGSGRISLLIQNCGATTARRFRHDMERKVVAVGLPNQLEGKFPELEDDETEVVKGATSGFHFGVSRQAMAKLAAGTHVLQVAYVAVFDDDLGGKYMFAYRREYSGADLSTGRRLDGFEFDLPILQGREN